jgi:hypothetical protein
VLVIRGRAKSNYRASFNRIYSVGSNGGWVQGSKLNPLESLTPPLTKRLGFAKQKDTELVRREAQHQAEFAAKMAPIRKLHEAEKVAGDAVEHTLLMESLGKPTPRKESEPRKAKEAEVFKCRPAKRVRKQCEHGRSPFRCKDCGTGSPKH